MACAGGSPKSKAVIEHPFPKREEIVELAQAPAPDVSQALADAELEISEWTLQGPLPAEPFGKQQGEPEPLVLAAQDAHPGWRITAGMSCYAREIAAFVAQHEDGSSPPVSLRNYMAARCGALPVSVAFKSVGVQDKRITDAQIQTQALNNLREFVAAAANDNELGVASFRSGDRVVVVACGGMPQAEVTEVTAQWDRPATVRIRGQWRQPAEWMRASSSMGALGYGECTPTLGSQAVLPSFDVQCPLEPSDESAMVEFLVGAPQQILGHTRLLVAVAKDADAGKLVKFFRGTQQDESQEESGTTSPTASFIANLNRVRGNQGYDPLRISEGQSQVATELLPHLIAAIENNDHAKQDLIGLGMLAGWEIHETIRNAGLLVYASRAKEGVPDLLANMLFLPTSRSVILDSQARKLAVAIHQNEEKNAATALVTTYTFFEEADYSRVQATLLDELDRQRRAKGLAPVQRIGGKEITDVVGPIFQSLAKGEIAPKDGLQKILDHYAQKLARPFSGYVMSTMVIDGWMPKFSGDLVEVPNLAVAAEIGHYTNPESSWGQFVVYFVYLKLS
jgi:hypothetical protein